MFSVKVDMSAMKQAVAQMASMESSVTNDAKSESGFRYFAAVDKGRKEVFPVNRKALKIRTGGGLIFRKHAKSAPAQNITERSLSAVIPNAINAAQQAHGSNLIVWARQFLRYVAQAQAQTLARLTPRGFSGKLGSSYKVNVRG